MKKIILALVLLLAPSAAFAQCTGVFPSATVCGSAAGGIPGPLPTSGFALAPGGTSGQIQFNNGSGGLGGFTASGDATINASTGVVTNAKINGVGYPTSPATNTVPVITSTGQATYTALPSCTSGFLQYTTSTSLFSCSAPVLISTAFATIKPNPSQGSGPWIVTDPFGNAISTSGTTCQGFDSLLAAAGTNHWSWKALGPGTLTCSSQITFPVCFSLSEYIDNSVTVQLGGGAVANSHENCYSQYLGQLIGTNSGGITLDLAPTSPTTSGNTVIAASFMEFGAIIPPSGGIGLQMDPSTGGIIGNEFVIDDINGGVVSLRVLNPSGSTAFESNIFRYRYIHGATGGVIQVGRSTTNQTSIRYNTWIGGRVDPACVSSCSGTIAIDTFATGDTWINPNVSPDGANMGSGFTFESGSVLNKVIGGVLRGTVLAYSSGVGGNVFIGVGNLSSQFIVDASVGTSCAPGAPSASFAVASGLVTHC